jgi:hypothetical protein
LLSGGPLFTEDLWQIVCDGLQEAVQATLFNIKDMVTCFQPGSLSVSGDEGMTVKVVARREAVHGDSFRSQQVAEQVGVHFPISASLTQYFRYRLRANIVIYP